MHALLAPNFIVIKFNRLLCGVSSSQKISGTTLFFREPFLYQYNLCCLFVCSGHRGRRLPVAIVLRFDRVGRREPPHKTYKKASKKGWEAFIPIYNTYVGCEICGISTYWILILVLIHFIVIPFPFLATITGLARLYFKVIFSISMARSFGKSDAFAVGLFFCEPIFYLILAFDNSTYLGPKPVDDPIIKILGVKNNDNSTGTGSSLKYCSNCGSPVKEESNYCSKCGNKI